MKNRCGNWSVLMVLVLGACLAPKATGQQESLEAFLSRAEQGVRQYVEAFRDLTAEETATIELWDSRGNLQRRTTLLSMLVIYRAQTDPQTFAEYRIIQSVDGHAVKDREQRAIKLWQRLASSRSVEDELRRISNEGARYNTYVKADGFTLFQGFPLLPDCRGAFSLEETGTEEVNGTRTRVFRYTQVAPCSFFNYKLALPSNIEPGRKLHRGRIWLEAATGRLIREERDVYVEPPRKPELQVRALHSVFEYAPSSFDVLVPALISMESYQYTGRNMGNVAEMRLLLRITQRYGPFSRFEVKVEQKIAEPRTPK